MATCGAWTGLPPPLRLTRQAAPGLRCAHTRISLLKHAGTPHHWQALELEACVSALSHGTTLKQQKTTQPAPYRNALCCFSGSERRSVSPRAVHRPPPPAMASSWRSHAVAGSVAGFAEPAAYRVLENVDPETTDVGSFAGTRAPTTALPSWPRAARQSVASLITQCIQCWGLTCRY